MKLTKQQLQTIIREEYVKVLFETRGRKISDNHAKVLVEGLDEGFFDSLKKGLKAGKEAFSSARSEEQLEKNEAAVVNAAEDIKKEIEKVRMDSKNVLKKRGWKGDAGDLIVLSVDIFEQAALNVLGLSESALQQRDRPKKLKSPDEDGSSSIAMMRRGRTSVA